MDIYLLCSDNLTEEHETASEKPDSIHSRTLITKALEFSYTVGKMSGNAVLKNAVYYLFLTETHLPSPLFW